VRIGIDVLHQISGGSLTSLVGLLGDWDLLGMFEQYQWVFFVSGNAAIRLQKAVPHVMAKVQVVRFGGSDHGLALRFIDEQVRLPRAIARLGLDVLFCPANIMPYRSPVPAVVMLQNAAPFCETVTIRSTGLLPWLRFALIGVFMRLSARRARRVIFLSRHMHDLFVSRFGFDPSRGRVVPHGSVETSTQPDPELAARLGIRGPFLFSSSHLNPYKNIVELVDGFAAAARDYPEWQLVLAGASHYPAYRAAIERARERAGADRVLIVGELPHADTLKLLAACEAFVFSSTCESCPMAILEAQALGAPIASSNVGAMPEIAGTAALYFDPAAPHDIAQTLRRLIADPELRQDLRRRSLAHAITWPSGPQTARQTLTAITDPPR
jgi:glycosyltransferase involved in cell wall biosynthesis